MPRGGDFRTDGVNRRVKTTGYAVSLRPSGRVSFASHHGVVKLHNVKQTFTSGYDPSQHGVAERWVDRVKIKATVLLAAHHLSTAYWNYAVAWVTYTYNRRVLAQPRKKRPPEFGLLVLVRSKREHKFQDKGELAIMMGFCSKTPNGIVALRVKDGQLRELCTAHCSPAHMEKNTMWFLKRDPENKEKRVYMSDKGEVSWETPISNIPTVEEKEAWDRHPKFISLQRSRDGWAWFTSNIGRLLPAYDDIEVEERTATLFRECWVLCLA